jgi:molybdate transport system substrate-binding protein
MKMVHRLWFASFAVLCIGTGPASADEIRVMTNGALAAAHLGLAPRFERATGHRIVTEATTTGVGSESIPSRVMRGDAVDVVLLTDGLIEKLIEAGKLRPGSRRDLARSGVGMAVQAGARGPDISSVDALKRTLLQAASIAYSAGSSGVYVSNELFPRLGIAEEMKAKSRRFEGEPIGNVVARGDAELGFQQISELLPIAGIEYVGPLPADVQRMTLFSAGIGSQARSPDAARAYIDYLSSPEARRVMEKLGLQPHERKP